jgi:DNA-directed RNA polymerase specialized sigma24 family protein
MTSVDRDRSEKILALLLLQQLKSASQGEKAFQLSIAGFTNSEIADLLDTNAAAIAQALYLGRRKPKSSAKKKKRKKK